MALIVERKRRLIRKRHAPINSQVLRTPYQDTSMPADSAPPPTSSVARYGAVAIAFHWSTFLLVVVVGVLGLLHDSWPKQTQAYWINVHAVIGLLLWVLLMARYGWRRWHAPPPLPAEVGAVFIRLSQAVHRLLYALLFITPIVGIVTFIWHGRIFDFGFFQVDFHVAKDHAVFGPTEDIHGYLAYAIFGIAGVHALAALWHHYVKQDGVLRRMWPAGAPPRAQRNGRLR